MQALHDAILEALVNGGMLPPDLFEQLFGRRSDGRDDTAQQQLERLEELVQQIIERMKESGYITTAPDLDQARTESARGEAPTTRTRGKACASRGAFSSASGRTCGRSS